MAGDQKTTPPMTEAEIKTALFRIHTALGGGALISAVLASWQVIEYEANPKKNKIDSALIDAQTQQIMDYLNVEEPVNGES